MDACHLTAAWQAYLAQTGATRLLYATLLSFGMRASGLF